MRTRHPRWVRRRPFLGLLAVVACVLAAWSGSVLLAFPGADGPRVVRQYLIAGLPAVVAPFLLDRTPELSLTLIRDRRERLVDQVAVVTTVYATLIAGWLGGVSVADGLYEALVANLLLAIVLGGTARYGLSAVLLVSALAATWLLAGDSLAMALGFGVVDYQSSQRIGVGTARWYWLACSATLLTVAFVLGLSRTWRAGSTRT